MQNAAPLHGATLFTAVILACACGGPAEPKDEGTYDGSVTGAVNASFQGRIATFFLAGSTNTSTLALRSNQPNNWHFSLYTSPSGRIAAGTTLPIIQDDGQRPTTPHAFVVVDDYSSNTTRTWNSQSGELVVTSTSSTRIAGRFTFAAREFVLSGVPREISVIGFFDAICNPAAC
jgi:hypothetical protein